MIALKKEQNVQQLRDMLAGLTVEVTQLRRENQALLKDKIKHEGSFGQIENENLIIELRQSLKETSEAKIQAESDAKHEMAKAANIKRELEELKLKNALNASSKSQPLASATAQRDRDIAGLHQILEKKERLIQSLREDNVINFIKEDSDVKVHCSVRQPPDLWLFVEAHGKKGWTTEKEFSQRNKALIPKSISDQIESLIRQVEELKNSNIRIEEERSRVERDFVSFRQRADAARDHIVVSSQPKPIEKETSYQWMEEYEFLKTRVTHLEDSRSQLESKLLLARERAVELRTVNADLKLEISSSRLEIGELKQREQKLRNDHDRLCSELEEIKKERDRLSEHHQVETAKRAMTRLNSLRETLTPVVDVIDQSELDQLRISELKKHLEGEERARREEKFENEKSTNLLNLQLKFFKDSLRSSDRQLERFRDIDRKLVTVSNLLIRIVRRESIDVKLLDEAIDVLGMHEDREEIILGLRGGGWSRWFRGFVE